MREAAPWGGNASSIHALGQRARRCVDRAIQDVRQYVGSARAEVVFTGGSPETEALALLGLARPRRRRSGADIVVLGLHETAAVRQAASVLADAGFHLEFLPGDAAGVVQPAALDAVVERLGAARIALLALGMAHPLSGVMQPVAALCVVAAARGIATYIDATQAPGKLPLAFDTWQTTALSLAAETCGAPAGLGALIVTPGTPLEPLWSGGGQQNGWRSGSLPVAPIAGFAAAVRQVHAAPLEDVAMAHARDYFEATLLQRMPDAFVASALAPRLPNTSLVGLPSIAPAILAQQLDRVAISVGTPKSPSVLGFPIFHGSRESLTQSWIAFSCGRNASIEGIDALTTAIEQANQNGRDAA